MNLVAVGLGGFFGAILRYKMGSWIQGVEGFPVGTLTINLLGCLFLSWFFTITSKRWNINPNLRLGIGTGFTGAFTTFSTFSVETVNLLNSNQFLTAILYVVSSVLCGVILAIAGARLAYFRPATRVEGDSE
jgi:fluoride exporter